MPVNKVGIVKYRISRAYETLKEAKMSLDNDMLFLASNRCYYAVFYIVSALAVAHDYSSAKHKQMMGWYNKSFIKTGEISKDLGKIYYKAFQQRQEGDYDDFVKFDRADLEKMLSEVERFVQEIEKYINDKIDN